MQKHGSTVKGTPRFYCKSCKSTDVRVRADTQDRHRKGLFVRWLLGVNSKETKAQTRGVSARTLSRWFEPFWEDLPVPIVLLDLSEEVVLVDGIYLNGRYDVVLIAMTASRIVGWHFARRECYASWLEFLKQIPKPKAIIFDGQKGLIKSVGELWPDIQIQRCQAHIIRLALAWLTNNPKTEAARDLRFIVSKLCSVHTQKEKERWVQQLSEWHKLYQEFLAEKTHTINPRGVRSWWYTHRKLRGVYSLIRNALPHLFTFLEDSQIPNTTNRLEGGINAQIAELVRRHRGFDVKQKQVMVAYYLSQKQ